MSEPANEPAGDSSQTESKPDQDTSAPKKPERSSTERLIVWGGIGVLLLLVVIQAHARVGYERTLKNVEARLAEDDGPNARPLMLEEVDSLIVGFPFQRTIEEKATRVVLNLSWRGLTSAYEINLPYNPTEPAILGVYTKDAPAFATAPDGGDAPMEAASPADMSAMTGPGGMPPGSPPDVPPQPTETDEPETGSAETEDDPETEEASSDSDDAEATDN